MPKPVLADTGPLYALADPSDQYHLKAQQQLERLTAAGRFVAITYLTLAESYTLILRRPGVAYAQVWLQEIVGGPAKLAVRTYDRHFDLLGSKQWE